jgi:hypothetical protein
MCTRCVQLLTPYTRGRADANNGWIYGTAAGGNNAGFIYRSHDGGVTWADETPNAVVVGNAKGPVYAISPLA